MEEMEVTPVTPLDDDGGENINIVSSNPLIANGVNYLGNPSVDVITMHSENDNSDSSVNEVLTVEIKTNNNSSLSCQSEKLPELFDNIQLHDVYSSEAAERNSHFNTENETVINYVGSCNVGFHNIGEACPAKSVTQPANQCPEISAEMIQNAVCNTDTNSAGFSTASLSETSTLGINFPNPIQTTKNGTTKVVCEAQTTQSCKSETKYDHRKAGSVRKECDIKPLQFDSLQKQTSEIKERVMGFLTKYTIADETSCGGHPCESKLECVEGKLSEVTNEKNIGSEIVGREQCEAINPKTASNVMTRNSKDAIVASSQTPKFHLTPVSKNSVTENCSQTSNISSTLNNMLTQQEDAINQQTICTTFVSQVPSQGNFNFSVSNDEPLSSTFISTSKNECTPKTSNDVMESHDPDSSPESNTDIFSFQPNSEIKLSFEQELKENSQSFDLKPDVQGISVCGTPGKNAKEIKKNELNPGNMSIEFLFPCSNDVFGSKMQCSPSQKQVTSPFLNKTTVNRVTCSFQRSTNTESVNSWGKMSGELHTTSSINSPILSSKSSNDSSSSKHISFSNNSFSPLNWPDNCELASKSGSKSRRTRSSDAMFYNIPKPFSNGVTGFSSNGNNKSQMFDNSYLVKPGEIDEINSPRFNFTDCGNTSKLSFISPQNINKNSQGMFGNCLGKSTYCANGETLHSDYKCFERPFGNNLTKGNAENPFTKKSPIESIGLFKSPIKTAACESENLTCKPSSSLLFSLKGEKTEECTGNDEVLGILKPAASKDPFDFPLGIKNRQNQETRTTAQFAFSNLCSDESFFSSSNSKVSSCGQTSNEDISEQTPFGNFERVPSHINRNSLFQFTFTPEKSKTFCTSTMTLPPRTRKPMRTIEKIRQFQKVTLKDMKGNVPSNVPGKGTEEVSFKPVYGSDVKFEKGMYKNVIVRYQNIVFMDDYSHVSPEEIRSQFYTKAAISVPFKFGACVESKENLIKGFKKTQNQEIQTDEQLASKNPDLNAIWRVLECPVCLDVVLPPVYQCEQGHHACATCWTKVLTCPLCKRPQSCTRNYMAEALVEQVPLPCRYHIEGCRETVQHNSKVNHEENCSYRMYQCPVPMCNQALSYQNMCKHFKKHHKNILHHEGHSVGKGEKFCDVLYKEALLSSLVHAFDITKWGLFFLREVAVGHSTAFFVQVMPAASDQAVYFYHLEVCDHHDCRKECFKGRVFLMCKPSQEIIDQEEYLCLSELILKTVKKTTPLKIVVTIWQLKPAFTLSSQ